MLDRFTVGNFTAMRSFATHVPSHYSEDAFMDTFIPIGVDGGEELMHTFDQTRGVNPRHVWTVVTGDDSDNLYAVPGYHVVNRKGYLITEKPWVTGDEEAVYFEAEPV